jgi:sterol desaturase/sphingolipid hydroxylase (fatty acid hydroxylase superfamily)
MSAPGLMDAAAWLLSHELAVRLGAFLGALAQGRGWGLLNQHNVPFALAVAVMIFEVLLNATAMFNHANVRLPPAADRLFRTYKAQPDAGHERMTIGIRGYRAPKLVSDLPGMLVLPFLGDDTGYAINRRLWERQL